MNVYAQYIGPIGKLVGGSVNPFGGDIGFELSGSFAAIVLCVSSFQIDFMMMSLSRVVQSSDKVFRKEVYWTVS